MGTYITSRSYDLPATKAEMSSGVWFSLWQMRLWPYTELERAETLWWYESARRRLRWKSHVTRVEAFHYRQLDDALDHLENLFGRPIDRGQEYLTGKPDEGFCVAYQVKALKLVDVARPEDMRFSPTGWERGDRNGIKEWIRLAE